MCLVAKSFKFVHLGHYQLAKYPNLIQQGLRAFHSYFYNNEADYNYILRAFLECIYDGMCVLHLYHIANNSHVQDSSQQGFIHAFFLSFPSIS